MIDDMHLKEEIIEVCYEYGIGEGKNENTSDFLCISKEFLRSFSYTVEVTSRAVDFTVLEDTGEGLCMKYLKKKTATCLI